MTRDAANFFLACGLTLLLIAAASLVAFVGLVVVYVTGRFVAKVRSEDRLADALREQHFADVRSRATERPSVVDTDDLFSKPWAVLDEEPPVVFPRRRRAA